MAINLLSPTIEINAISFLDSSKSNYNLNHVLKLQGGFSFKRKDYGGTIGKKIQCSVQPPPPAWPGQARQWQSLVGRVGLVQSLFQLFDQQDPLELRHWT